MNTLNKVIVRIVWMKGWVLGNLKCCTMAFTLGLCLPLTWTRARMVIEVK